ncbi:MAG TPA: NADH-quinone oxidoreductase subunit C [Dehalococcoidia bacterium]|jgi:NADH-quinone oxidoreductase subunit C|nr:NADH-quinone oxidoreductase subunit C [Chloroflexota bacterium]MDP5876284.1 NADH-quinone oxidoreductase subunit C [Dehalococcoidia bacterium]MDP6272917.1 NADH-quinone oxidoreductase subunit C [Dehalococcoidia bacterium]MDP7160583.1 NADH-quinone oxidoreductase subunit C [Dehalococcoidia bacterium]MDP7212616.1 NADH-quinone oxidoreductase subunit C [Dehalococcoidia bacterium]|tara:strand:- start:305 stop:751 length:447 start_codon:yes stop_codon:yes gene_type:complete
MPSKTAFHSSGEDLTTQIEAIAAGSVTGSNDTDVWVSADRLPEVMGGLKAAGFQMLIGVTGVDYVGYFEMVYHLLSLSQNRRAIVKVRCGEGRVDPVVPSVLEIWRGAELQEREVYDLMGIRFEGRDEMKRIFLWEGFEGHPHRKDFL